MAKVRGRITPPKQGRSARKGESPARAAEPRARRPRPKAASDSTQPSALPSLPREARRAKVPAKGIIAEDTATTAKRVMAASPVQHAARSEARRPPTPAKLMELHWGDSPPPPSSRAQGLVQRWVKRGDALLRHLAEHGVARHEYRADLKEGRFVWISPEGRVSAEAEVQVICTYARTTSAISMAWADPMIRSAAIPRLDGMPSERDDIDEESAWRVAMQ